MHSMGIAISKPKKVVQAVPMNNIQNKGDDEKTKSELVLCEIPVESPPCVCDSPTVKTMFPGESQSPLTSKSGSCPDVRQEEILSARCSTVSLNSAPLRKPTVKCACGRESRGSRDSALEEGRITPSVTNPLERLRRSNLKSFSSVDSSATCDTYNLDKAGASGADMLFSVLRIFTYVIDVGTDLFLTYEYYKKGHVYWFSYTLSFILVPSVIMSIFTLVLYIRDWRIVGVGASFTSWVSRMFFLVFQLAPLIRIFETTFFACKSRMEKDTRKKREYYERWLDEDTDSMLLRLFEAFLEAAPQLVLQIYIVCKLRIVGNLTIAEPDALLSNTTYDVTMSPGGMSVYDNVTSLSQSDPLTDPSIALQVIGLLTSWLTMTSTTVTFHKSLRLSQPKKAKLRFVGMVTMFFWRLFTIASRVMALALFGSVRGFDLFWVIGAHWVLMLMWMIVQETDYCTLVDNRGKEHRSPILEFGFRVVTAFIHIFCFFNLIEGHTRLRCVTYYTVVYIENVAMVMTWYWTVWGRTTETWYYLPALLVVLVGFWIGIFFQVLYYKFFHPNNISAAHYRKRIRWCIPFRETYLCKEISDDIRRELNRENR